MTISQISSGRLVDLLRPDLSRIDVRRDIAEPLADLARFNGHRARRHPKGHIWSVGQHCVVGAKALLEETGNPLVAFAFLLHDAHEAFIGDIPTPVVRAMAAEVGPTYAPILRGAVARIKARLDHEIHRLAGLPPLPKPVAESVHDMDRRMLAAEARQILGVSERNLADWGKGFDLAAARPVRTHGALSPWSPKRTADEWMSLWDMWRIRPESIPTDPIHRRDGAAVAA